MKVTVIMARQSPSLAPEGREVGSTAQMCDVSEEEAWIEIENGRGLEDQMTGKYW